MWDKMVTRICMKCKIETHDKLKLCSACKFCYYCLTRCQEDDWLTHKEICMWYKRKKIRLGIIESILTPIKFKFDVPAKFGHIIKINNTSDFISKLAEKNRCEDDDDTVQIFDCPDIYTFKRLIVRSDVSHKNTAVSNYHFEKMTSLWHMY